MSPDSALLRVCLLVCFNAYPHATDVRLGLRLLSLTAARPSELREARWTEFDLGKKLVDDTA
jgi:integrase